MSIDLRESERVVGCGGEEGREKKRKRRKKRKNSIEKVKISFILIIKPILLLLFYWSIL